jgi:hypothetical protein
MANLNANSTDFVAIGASEMARLAKAACNGTEQGAPAPEHPVLSSTAAVPPPLQQQSTCVKDPVLQDDCGFFGVTEAACAAKKCCWWTPGALQPTGHTCIYPETPRSPVPTCTKPRKV